MLLFGELASGVKHPPEARIERGGAADEAGVEKGVFQKYVLGGPPENFAFGRARVAQLHAGVPERIHHAVHEELFYSVANAVLVEKKYVDIAVRRELRTPVPPDGGYARLGAYAPVLAQPLFEKPVPEEFYGLVDRGRHRRAHRAAGRAAQMRVQSLRAGGAQALFDRRAGVLSAGEKFRAPSRGVFRKLKPAHRKRNLARGKSY